MYFFLDKGNAQVLIGYSFRSFCATPEFCNVVDSFFAVLRISNSYPLS